jgi:hypothetical protein
LGVARSGLKPLKRQTGLLIAGALLVLVEATPAGAAGCHVPDRPVLGTRLSWETDPDLDLSRAREAQPPPVLTHPPCSGELPHLLSSSSLNPGFVHAEHAALDPSALTGILGIADDVERLDPLGSRLDRPPRVRALYLSFA